MRGMKKPLRQVLREFPAARARLLPGGHWCISTPRGSVIVSATASDWRALKNIRAELRRRFGRSR